MNDNFKNKDIKLNEEIDDREDALPGSLTKRKVRVMKICGFIFLLSACFFISFYFSSKVLNKNTVDESNNSNKNVTNLNSNVLGEDYDIILKTGNEESVCTVAEYKKQNNIDDNLTEGFLTDKLGQNGYKLKDKNNDSVTFVKDSNYIPGKYYLGISNISNNYIAVYKADESGSLKLEQELKEPPFKEVSLLSPQAKKELETYVHSFDSIDQAEEVYSSFGS
ncbi:MAG: hypothetical protein RR620_02490 [Clostridium sp.]